VARSQARVASALPELLELAGELIGEDCFELAGESTRFAQPAIFLSSLAGFLELQDSSAAEAFAGHSLGELTALAAAGALAWEDALGLVVMRGALMDESGRSNGGDGSMLALLKSTPEEAAAVASAAGVWVANDNCPPARPCSPARARDCARQPRSPASVACARSRSTSQGRFTPPWMAAAQDPFREALEHVAFGEPAVTVYLNGTNQGQRESVLRAGRKIVEACGETRIQH